MCKYVRTKVNYQIVIRTRGGSKTRKLLSCERSSRFFAEVRLVTRPRIVKAAYAQKVIAALM
jgi:hypothetical protein